MITLSSASLQATALYATALLLPLLPGAATAQQVSTPQVAAQATPLAAAAQIVVSATRIETPAFDVPASIDRIGRDGISTARGQVNLSESLGPVPGLLARDRQNYAQDVQLSVRGFGARASFGIRGVRLYVDGIPATLPDGQGQISHVDLGSAERIELLRGPFSALYGNSSGGVLQVFSEQGDGPPTAGLSLVAGSDGLQRAALKLAGSQGSFGYLLSASRFRTDGYRAHSATERTLGNLLLTLRPDSDTRLTLVANRVDMPRAQDPLGLTRAQFEADPRSVDPSALRFDTRKTMDQTQAGLIAERRLGATQSLRLMVYGGERHTEQVQAIPSAPQASALHPGGVIQLARRYHGLDARWTLSMQLAGAPLTVVAGLVHDALQEHRIGRQNFIGSTLGVAGALRRDEDNEVSNLDPYLQAAWQLAPAWALHAGLRRSSVRFSSTDHYIAGANPDDSGGARYRATLPVLGLLHAVNDSVHVYATAGKGFETPTLNELSYRPNGATGMNFNLRAARSDNLEAGVKLRSASIGQLNAALFQTRTEQEIVTLASSGGRTTFQNAGSTRRSGMELAWSQRWADALQARLAATWLDARYHAGYAAGQDLPGVARSSVFAALNWAPATGWRGGLELRALSRVFVNDSNSDAAPSFTVAGAWAGYTLRAAGWELSSFLRGENLGNRHYAGSVIVNESNGRVFEPAPGRSWNAGLSGSLSF